MVENNICRMLSYYERNFKKAYPAICLNRYMTGFIANDLEASCYCDQIIGQC